MFIPMQLAELFQVETSFVYKMREDLILGTYGLYKLKKKTVKGRDNYPQFICRN